MTAALALLLILACGAAGLFFVAWTEAERRVDEAEREMRAMRRRAN